MWPNIVGTEHKWNRTQVRQNNSVEKNTGGAEHRWDITQVVKNTLGTELKWDRIQVRQNRGGTDQHRWDRT